MYAEAEDLFTELLHHFPKLRDGGGYELLLAGCRGGRELTPLEPPSDGYSVQFLKSVVAASKIFVRPLQKDLNIELHSDANDVRPHDHFNVL